MYNIFKAMKIHKIKSKRELFQWFKAYIINTFVDSDYLLLLSGGDGPRELYRMIQGDFSYPFPEDVGMVDEIWGENPLHPTSNALMVRNTGMVGRIEWQGSEWHPILTGLYNHEVEAERYQEELLGLFNKYGENILSILSIGKNGEIAGILPNSNAMESNKQVVCYQAAGSDKKIISVSAECIKNHFKYSVLVLNGEDELSRFEEISENGLMDGNPVGIFKDMDNFEVLCLYQ